MMPDHYGIDGVIRMHSRKSVASSPLEKVLPIGGLSVDCSKLSESYVARDQKGKLHIDEDGTANLSGASWSYIDSKRWSKLYLSTSCSVDMKRTSINEIQYENSVFSSSLSDVFTRKLKLPANDVLFDQSNNMATSHYEAEEPFESTQEIEAQTIGDLLPDEDDIFSGMIDEVGCTVQANASDDAYLDLFSSGGGMELEGDNHTYAGQRNADSIAGIFSGQGSSNGSLANECPCGEQPARTLFVRNISSNVEDSELRTLFKQFGDIRTIYTSCKHHGFVLISYFDIRAAMNAMRALKNKPLRCRKLDIHYSGPKENPAAKDSNHGTLAVFNLDTSVSNDELCRIFGIYGEIKEIHETPHECYHKFIEFYDIRAAEAALHTLNRSDIAGKWMKLELSDPFSARPCVTQQCSSELVLKEPCLCRSPNDKSSECIVSPRGITPSCRNAGSIKGLHSARGISISAFTENAFQQGSSNVPKNLPSTVRAVPVCNQRGLYEPNHSVDCVKLDNRCIPITRPHSLPQYHDGLANMIPFNTSTAVVDVASDTNPAILEGTNDKHIRVMGSNAQSMELNGRVVGSSGNGSTSLRGHHHLWSYSNSFQHNPSSPMISPNSPSFVNGVHACCPPQLSGLSTEPAHMLNTISLAHQHHIGSAPAVNPSCWERQQVFRVESAEASGFDLGSLGSVGFPGSSLLHPSEVVSHNIFSRIGGNCVELLKNAALHSPQQNSYIFPGQSNGVTLMSSSFGSPSERMRNILHRRNETSSCHAEKKQYELDINRILRGEDSRTTLMIKNIPNKYTSKMLLAAIDEQHRGTYDFIYLPIDFKNKCNVGYAFINMIDPLQIIPFHKAFNGKKWEKFNSEKVALLAYARIQGKAALIAHFQKSSLMNEDKRCRPILFHTDGPNAGDQEPFPMGTNVYLRAGKSRSSVDAEIHYQGSPSASGQGEESSNKKDSVSAPKVSD